MMDISSLIQDLAQEVSVITAADEPAFGNRLLRWSEIERKTPAAIILPLTEEDCQRAVLWAVSNKVPFVTKAGGMSLYSTTGEEGVVIDLSGFSGVEVDKKGKTATLIGGVATKTVAVALAKDGVCTALPSANTVGAIPFFLNGGNSPLASKVGFGSDLIMGARMITASGDLVEVDEAHNPELLFALRGAGQYFGLVTSLTVKTFTFEEALGNSEGKLWSGRFVFPLERIVEVCEVMKTIVKDEKYATNGLIAIGAPPPARQPGVAVLAKLVAENPSAVQEEAFKPLYDLGPLVSGGAELPIQNNGDALDPLCAPGGFKRLQLTGVHSLNPDSLEEIAMIWRSLTSKYPDAIGTTFGFQWDSRFPKKRAFESANSMHSLRFWGNNMIWCTEKEHVEGLEEQLWRVVHCLRKGDGQREEDFVDFANSSRGEPVERRYKGAERLGKLREVKRMWDGEAVFTGEFL